MKKILPASLLIVGALVLGSNRSANGQPNILTNGDFEADPEGTVGGGTDVIDSTSVTGWRIFGVGGATGTATVTSAAGRSGQGIELVRTAPLGADSAFDKDDPSLREAIMPTERIYNLTVDARDGGPFGGTPALGMGIQFADLGFNRGTSFDPGADFETFGLAARSDTGGQVSTRFDLAGAADRSVHLDNATLTDVTTGVNRVLNGGFENSATRLLNWRFFDVIAPTGSATLSADANSGSQAVLLTVDSTPLSDIGLDLEPWRIPTITGEELTLSLAAKQVAAEFDETRLRVSVAGFDASGAHVGDFVSQLINPVADTYNDFSIDFIVPDNVNFINVGIRIWDELGDSFSAGSYLIDDVSVMRLSDPGDFNGDGDVDGNDFLVWQQGGSPDPLSGADLDDWKADFGSNPPAAATLSAVPEPSAVLQFMILGLVLASTSRRRFFGLSTGE